MDIFGVLAATSSLGIVLIGLPAQIRKNKRTKVFGIAPSVVYGALATYLLWSIHGWMIHDLFLKISQTPGVFMSLVLLAQRFKYPGEKTESDGSDPGASH